MNNEQLNKHAFAFLKSAKTVLSNLEKAIQENELLKKQVSELKAENEILKKIATDAIQLAENKAEPKQADVDSELVTVESILKTAGHIQTWEFVKKNWATVNIMDDRNDFIARLVALEKKGIKMKRAYTRKEGK